MSPTTSSSSNSHDIPGHQRVHRSQPTVAGRLKRRPGAGNLRARYIQDAPESPVAPAIFSSPLFTDGEDQYLYIDDLGSGAESIAHRVLHVQTGEERVRKVSRRHFTQDEAEFTADIEARALALVQTTAKARGVPQPNIVYLHSKQDILMGREPVPRYARVAYSRLCNGGDLSELRSACARLGLTVPPTLTLRLIRQVSEALQFLSTCSPAIEHGDLHDGNIFLHWARGSLLPDFYVGDFGMAVFRHSQSRFEDCFSEGIREMPNRGLGSSDLDFVQSLAAMFSNLSRPGPRHSRSEEILSRVEAELGVRRPALPYDFARVISLASSAGPSSDEDRAELEQLRSALGHVASASPRRPLCYDSHDEALSSIKTRTLDGPFKLARVSLDTEIPQVLEVSEESHHFPPTYIPRV